jgi:hypothetical protein
MLKTLQRQAEEFISGGRHEGAEQLLKSEFRIRAASD